MTARSFSIPTTLPLTTVPSCKLPWPNASSSIAAKSSRVGAAAAAVAVAMNSPVAARQRVGIRALRELGPQVPRDLRQPPRDGGPALDPIVRNDDECPAQPDVKE